jgi:cellulose synthase/poly-beta-1,6-N-acetylglucosamine synthase-like glycosyltransferase
LKKIGFDHRTLGEDFDATYRAYAYFGMHGIEDPNIFFHERIPPTFKALSTQRIRWGTAGFERRKSISWIWQSPHYTLFERLAVSWMLLREVPMPLQQFCFDVYGFLSLAVFTSRLASVHENPDCQSFWFAMVLLAWTSVQFGAYVTSIVLQTLLVTHQCPALWLATCMPIESLMYQFFGNYVKLWIYNNYMWGISVFICTPRIASAAKLECEHKWDEDSAASFSTREGSSDSFSSREQSSEHLRSDLTLEVNCGHGDKLAPHEIV